MDIRRFIAVCMCIFSVSLVSGAPLGTRLSVTYGNPLFPADPVIGQLVSQKNGQVETLTAQALSENWSVDWLERYVSKDMRYGFSKSFNDILASLLPQKGFVLSAAKKEEDIISVPIRLSNTDDLEITYVTFVWEVVKDGGYQLVSLSLDKKSLPIGSKE
ncbi:hypothetical protein [uncultured Sphaerochaeta sp.]|uniref:hypothetical protein n=1 Tax=uncultured Sphaerochaeta sp. TaxID=886478 RepID=UPI002A0A16CA|nr:hypothetical protein [uncultured Sphaerochaeta sp.]